MKGFFLLFCLCLVTAVKQDRVREVDLVLEDITRQEWSQEEKPCFDQTVLILENVKNYTVWAMWIWNSMEHPVGTFHGSQFSLGSYDQCLETPSIHHIGISTQYCLAEVKLTKDFKGSHSLLGDTESYLGTRTEFNRDLSQITWGSCVPAVCKPRSVAKILKAIYMVNPLTPAEPTITIDYCQRLGDKAELTIGAYVFIAIVISLVGTALISTYYVHNADPKSTTTSIANAFCIKRNWNSLIKESTDDIPVINSLKITFTAISVIIHSFYFRLKGPSSNGIYFDNYLSPTPKDSLLRKLFRHCDLPVDIFFVMAGLLLIKGLVDKKKNPVVSLISRYFRLIGTFALIMLYLSTISIHMGDGPLWQRLAGREQEANLKSWFWGLLMLNNEIASDQISQIVTWHIPCDYQLAVMGTIIYMIWQKNYRLKKLVTICVAVLALVLPAAVTYRKNISGLILGDDIEQRRDFRINRMYLDAYIKFYYRAVPYLLGMGLGYIMTVFKTSKDKKILSTKWSIILLLASFAVGIKVMTGAVSWCRKPGLSTAICVSLNKLFFGLATCVGIGAVQYGNIPIVDKIMRYHWITVLSRLTYGSYLTHTLFLQQNSFSRRHVLPTEMISEITYGLGVVVLCVAVSTLLWIFVEAPLNNLVNLVTNSGCPSVKIVEVKDESKEDSEERHFEKLNGKPVQDAFNKINGFAECFDYNYDKLKEI